MRKIQKCDEDFLEQVFEKYYGDPSTTHIAEQIEDLVFSKQVEMKHEDKVKALTDFPTTYYFMNDQDRANRELAVIALTQKPRMYAISSEELKNDEALAVELAKSPNLKYSDLGCFSHSMRSNPRVVLEVAKQDVEHATCYQMNLDKHFEKNINEDKYDETCIKSLETEINYQDLKAKLVNNKPAQSKRLKM